MKAGLNSEGAKNLRVPSGVILGLVSGAVIAVIPFELIVLSLPAILVIAIFLCWRNPHRVRVVPVAALLAAVVATAMGMLTPSRLDRRPVRFPTNTITLGELVHQGLAYPPANPDLSASPLRLPSDQPSVREIIRAVNDQTSCRADVFQCGNGASIFGGPWISKIRFHPRNTSQLAGETQP